MAVIGGGALEDGGRWELDVEGDADDLLTTVHVTRPDGHRPWSLGCGGPALHPGARLNLCAGSTDEGPSTVIARVADDVAAVVVMLSDGTREDLVLHGDPAALGARVAVLVHPASLDVHRIDLLDRDGRELDAGT
ncbi:hypothetical protein ACXR2U_00040 [Jatrophihabitans sp. YIM 134969]